MILLMMPNIDLRMVDNRNETFWNNVIFAKKTHAETWACLTCIRNFKKEDHSSGLLNFTYTSQNDNNSLVHNRFLWEYNHSLISSQTTFFDLFEYIVFFFYEYSELLLTFITWLYMYELIYDDPHQILYHDLSLVYPLLLLL